MLFDFERDQEISMWMRNTLIPLDMIFIRATAASAGSPRTPSRYRSASISSGGPVRAVLEVSGGTRPQARHRPRRPGRASDVRAALGRAPGDGRN